ncbi:MAG: hypothetical protein JJU24_08250, partial [Natronohydrobacter sp.]|nr:hypothetical protein [Natronohydrobacter sp.]
LLRRKSTYPGCSDFRNHLSNTSPTPAVPTRVTNAPPEPTTQTAQAYTRPQNARQEAQIPVARPSNDTDTMAAHIAREQTDTNTVFGVLSEEEIDAAVNNPNGRAMAEWITSETLPWERSRAQQPETQALTPEEWRHLVMQIPTDTSQFCAGMPPPYTGFTNNDRLRRLVNEYNAHSQCLFDTDQRNVQRARETVVALGGTVGDDGSVHLKVNARCDPACNDALLERFRGWAARRARLALHNETFQRQMHYFQRRIP